MADQRSQTFVPLDEIRDGIVVLKNGTVRAILMASSVNFALKAAEEQEAILKQFQNFLNTLDFSLQIYVQSRELDINPYLALLASRERDQKNDLMRIQLREYMGFIKKFISESDIMTKTFYVVVSYEPAAINVTKGIKSLFGDTAAKKSAAADSFEESRMQLEQRISVVEQGLVRIGIRTVMLGTDEIVDLFYHIFNPNEGKQAPPPHTS